MTAPVKIYSQEWPEGAIGVGIRTAPDDMHPIPYIREDVVEELAATLRECSSLLGRALEFMQADHAHRETFDKVRDALKKVEGL